MTVDPAEPATSTLAHSAELRRELGVRDLVFAQVLMVVGGSWVGTAAKLGAANVGYWLLAASLFFLPHVVVVLFLNRWAPIEGGPYQWAKLAFGPGFGFLVAFNLWLYAISLTVNVGLDVVQALAYAFDRLAWMRTDPLVAPIASVAIIAALAAEALAGLHFGKRLHNAGGVVRFSVFALLLLTPLVALVLAHPLRAEATHLEVPTPTLLGVNLLAKMGFGAFCGLEYAAIFAGESRNPARAFARSVYVGAPLIVVMFVGGTAAVLAFVAPADVDLLAPIPQVLGVATAGLGPVSHIASVATVLWVLTLIATGGVGLAGITRLPMVAGWDGLLPAWFMRLSPRSRVPVNSILFVSAVSATLSVLGLTGVEHQEAYQLFLNTGLVCWALTYLVMFAIPILGRGPGMPRPPVWLRVAAVSGWGMTLLFVVFAVVPIVRVVSAAAFGLKMIGVVAGANAVGIGLYLVGKRRGAPAAAA
jgi:amino acid transporter